MIIQSPAKLNLIFKVVGKLPNNYHLLEMLNILIDLEDAIEIEEATADTIVTYDKYTIDKKDDIIYNSVTEFIKKHNLPNQQIHIVKNIPVGGGLGGVSSNTATIIKHLNTYYNLNLSKSELIDFVLPYGTDICYTLFDTPAIVKGIGEQVEPIELKEQFKVLIVNPQIKIETKYIYNKVKDTSKPMLDKNYIYNRKITDILENDFEKIVFKEYPKMQEVKERLSKYLKNIHMSGSGSTLYSIIYDEELNIIEKIKVEFPNYLIGIYNIKKENTV